MSIGTDFLKELLQEGKVTRRYLEVVPMESADFSPSEKSESLGRLAIHLAETMEWFKQVITKNELDFKDFEPKDIKTNQALISYFDE